MIMQAVVLESQWGRLLVLDLDSRQQVLVHTPEARWINPGDFVRIWYNGVMTRSIPPQITAMRIVVLPQNAFPPIIAPPIIRPPVVLPPVIFPPVVRPPMRPQPPRPPHPPRPPRPGHRPR